MTMTCDFLQNLFDRSRKLHYICIHKQQAKVAQLVERNLAKVEVASSNLVFRSKRSLLLAKRKRDLLLKDHPCLDGGTGRHAGLKILFALKRVRVRFPLQVRNVQKRNNPAPILEFLFFYWL